MVTILAAVIGVFGPFVLGAVGWCARSVVRTVIRIRTMDRELRGARRELGVHRHLIEKLLTRVEQLEGDNRGGRSDHSPHWRGDSE